MSQSYPPHAPRKLYRSRPTKLIGGVCGGLADYLNMDVTLVRILTAVISLFTGVPIVLYILALFLIPEEPAGEPFYPSVSPTSPAASDVWGSSGAPWEQPSQPATATRQDPTPVEPEQPKS